MFGEPFYHNTLRKTVIAFGSLFNNIYIQRIPDDVKIKVPIIYSTKETFFQRYKDVLKRGQGEAVIQTILPKLGFEIGEIEYDSSRKKPSVNRRFVEITENGTTTIASNYTEVPYNVNFSLTGYFRYMDDALQVAEQILPYFTPDFTVAIKQNVLQEDEERMNVPIVLNSTGLVAEYEGAMDLSPRIIMWNYSFTAKINFFGPLNKNVPVITKVEANMFSSEPEAE